MEYRHSHQEILLLPDKEEKEEESESSTTTTIIGSSFEVDPSDRPCKTLRLSSSCSSLDTLAGSESDNVWKICVKKPGVLTLTRVSEEGGGTGTGHKPLPELQTKTRKIRASSRTNKSVANLSLESTTTVEAAASPLPPPGSRKGESGTRGMYHLSSRKRRSLLRSSGCLVLDPEEAEANKVLRLSRRACGCTCAGACRPERGCECAEAGVSCTEERPGTPCACTADNCGNAAGRRRFDPTTVKMHFIQTMLEVQGALSIS